MKETLRIVARRFDAGEMGQRDDDGTAARRLQFAAGVAKTHRLVAIEDGVRGFQKTAPVGVHEGSFR